MIITVNLINTTVSALNVCQITKKIDIDNNLKEKQKNNSLLHLMDSSTVKSPRPPR